MLKKVQATRFRRAGGRFAIIASKYNQMYVDGMLRAAQSTFEVAGAKDITVVRVPGAYEIPIAAARVARRGRVSGIVCLGVILRGETAHADLIGQALTRALMEIQLESEIPIAHEVLLLDSEQQAVVRCLGKKHNRGAEAAQTALEMAAVMKQLKSR